MKNFTLLLGIIIMSLFSCAQSEIKQNGNTEGSNPFAGIVQDSETNEPLSGVEVILLKSDIMVKTDAQGKFSISVADSLPKTIGFIADNYMYEEYVKDSPAQRMIVKLRKKKKSTASQRWDKYMESCKEYNSPEIPENEDWSLDFKESELRGDFAPDSKVIRRDPSAVIKVGDLYYVWYTKGSGPSTWFRSNEHEKVFPWDLCDVWYATSSDGWKWDEMGPAVERGSEGSFDDRSVFTPEVFAHNGKYYLVYQVVKAPYVIRVKNNVAMAVADSPDGPWRKLEEPILKPSNNGIWKEGSTSHHDVIRKGDFDSHKVHDPCLLYYKDKFYLYYKGERMGEEKICGEREIKWGVAIADNPEGPYIKSEYNPITNTGHEVCVWPYKAGIAIIQKLDGPEKGTVQFAVDGVNFEIMSHAAKDMPDAFGLYRAQDTDASPTAGISWGLCHAMVWSDVPGGWMYLRRFDLVKEDK